MYNENIPTRAELPTSAQLIKSTVIAVCAAILLLFTVVLPSEYGIDHTGVGRILGLTKMGEIKEQLAEEAAADQAKAETLAIQEVKEASALQEQSIARPEKETLVIEETLPEVRINEPVIEEPIKPVIRDKFEITLAPGVGTEVKLVMPKKGMVAYYEWTSNGAKLNYDTHGDGGGNNISYEKGRGVPEDAGELVSAFAGNHGWFWRNRTDKDVTLTLRTWGEYEKLVHIK
ncbi:transmembrane anchor protein [Curvivirga sp.]|uniref:transmembrane anchor protein n=1 Tax=Curvivirga sp. TaxID=2856848 RepID=UPI003B58B947